jgi:uncharacterized GH25 family protein
MHPLSSFPRAVALAVALLQAAGPAAAHEFWIEPDRPRAEVGETVRAELRVGRVLVGETYPYLSDQIVAARLHAPGGVTDIAGMEGDLPALSVTPAEPGLHVIAYHAAPAYTVFEELADFAAYLDYEGLGAVAELHKARGLPGTEIAEAYVRNARALLQVGPADPADTDRPTGMPLELVALGNPHAEGTEEIEVQLLWQGAPLPDRQVSVFQRPAETEATRSLLTTDAEGKIVLPLGEEGFVLLNAVQIKPVSGPGSVVWESHWASLTFTVEAP